MSNARLKYVPLALTLALLGGLTAETLSRPTPKDAEPFHRRVREAVAQMPVEVGAWVGKDVEIPEAAVALLRPNVILNRRYERQGSGQTVDLLLVHCRDARDMAGHYPPVCYPAHGWTPRFANSMTWKIGDLAIPGMEYEYSRTDHGQAYSTVVISLMILPNGKYVREMKEIRTAASDFLTHFYGAAQVQLVMDARVSADDRMAIFNELIGANLPILQALCSGGTK